MGAVPDFLLAFAVIFAFCERKQELGAYVFLACAVVCGACIGRSFPITVLGISVAGIAAHGAYSKMKYIPECVRAIFITAVAAFAIGAAEFFVAHTALSVRGILYGIVPYTAYTTAAACIMYPIMKKTLFKTEDKKLFVI
jgi:predicted metal-binding protein